MSDRPLDVTERAAVAAYLEQHSPKHCPRTATGEALPLLGMTMADHVRIAHRNANARRAAEAKAQAA
jgi:hypothetical protein